MLGLQCIFEWFCLVAGSILFLIFLVHTLTALYARLFVKPVKLNSNSLVVLVGGCMGIGKQMALELAEKYQCRLLIIDIRKDLFQETIEDITRKGSKCECLHANLGDPDSVTSLITTLLARNQPINLFLYNAGIVFGKTTWEHSEQQHMLLMRVNYFTPTRMIRELEPLLIGQHVAVVASMVAIIDGGLHVSTYGASKHAIFSYLTSLRQEYRKYKKDITVSIGCPYAINTTLFKGYRTKLDFIFRMLDQTYVAKRLIREFVARKEVCFMYSYQVALFRLISLFPSHLIDFAATNLDQTKLDATPSSVRYSKTA